MNPVLAQWLPAIFIVLAVWVGLLYNNKRLDDFKDPMNAAIGRSSAEMQTRIIEAKSEMQTQIMESEKRILQAIAELRVDIQNLDRRVGRLEAPYIRS